MNGDSHQYIVVNVAWRNALQSLGKDLIPISHLR